jgi:hypothetical protein
VTELYPRRTSGRGVACFLRCHYKFRFTRISDAFGNPPPLPPPTPLPRIQNEVHPTVGGNLGDTLSSGLVICSNNRTPTQRQPTTPSKTYARLKVRAMSCHVQQNLGSLWNLRLLRTKLDISGQRLVSSDMRVDFDIRVSLEPRRPLKIR